MDTFCSNCGRSLIPDDHFCPQCGKPISSSARGFAIPSNTPTIPAAPFQNTPPMPSTDYGSNPYGVTASNPYDASSLKPPPPPRPHRNRRLGILIGVGLLVLLLGNISTWIVFIRGTQTNANTTSATALSISNSHGKLLYTADWSNGLNGWTGNSDWSVLNGILHNDGTDSSGNSPTIVAPYQVEGITDYAVEIHMQVITGASCFDVTTLRASGSGNIWQGYKATICSGNAYIDAGTITGNSFDQMAQVHFNVGTTWHTYRFEVKGTRLSYLIDGNLIVGVNDSRYASGGLLGFKSYETQLNISSFKVFAL